MDVQDAKKYVDTFFKDGHSREETVELISALPLNGETADVFIYIDTKYQTTSKDLNEYNLTDAGNAEYFVSLYGDKMRYDHRRLRWLEWDGVRWHEDPDGKVLRMALAACRARYKAAASIPDLEKRKDISKYTIESEARARLEACLAIAKCLLPIADSGEHWDENPWQLCVKNGVIDLKTGELMPGNQTDRITMQSPVTYDAGAKAPRWELFLNEVFAGDSDLISWQQKYLGYCLSGDTREQILVMGHGSGANGKGRELAILRYVLGDYAYDAPFSTFELAARAVIPNDLAALVGRRFVTSSETNTGTRFNEARIKALTGQDAVTARFLHCEFFTFQPTAKYFLAVNHCPRVHDDSYGFWRRVRLIPFTQEFKGANDDKMLLDKLITEAPGILNWLIEGCLRWQKEGMEPTPECVSRATTEYQSDSDPLSEFILDECIMNPRATGKSIALYKAYQKYCRDQGMTDKEIMSTTAFGRRMSQKFKKSHKEGGTIYSGVALKTDGLLTGFEAINTNNDVSTNFRAYVENNTENPSEPVNPSGNPSELPDCSECGANDWEYLPDGKTTRCGTCGCEISDF